MLACKPYLVHWHVRATVHSVLPLTYASVREAHVSAVTRTRMCEGLYTCMQVEIAIRTHISRDIQKHFVFMSNCE